MTDYIFNIIKIMPETFLPTEGSSNDVVQFDSEEIASVLNSRLKQKF